MNSAAPTSPVTRTEDLWAQIARITFRFLFAIAAVVAAGWTLSNVHQVPADSRAVIRRFGAIVGERGPGLLVAWPRPIEDVVILPARDRQIELDVGEFHPGPTEAAARLDQEIGSGATRNTAFLLTGDSGLVRLQAAVFYQINDASAYVLEAQHVGPALRRLFTSSAVAVCAARDLDAILIARGTAEADPNRLSPSRQERFRADLVAEMNHRLAALAADGPGLGITVSRIDLTASLPAEAKAAFDQVLTVTQTADREVAVARADAARITQSAHQEQERILTQAAALAAERDSEARSRTASITAINPRYAGLARQALVNRIYYERIAALLRKAGRVDAIDPRSASQRYLPGRAE